jgi:ParB/Sulfiredoxin domain
MFQGDLPTPNTGFLDKISVMASIQGDDHSTDWDRVFREKDPRLTEVHRGMRLWPHADVYEHVNDQSRPVHERAHALLGHIGDLMKHEGRGIGMSWTDDPSTARQAADEGGWSHHGLTGHPGTEDADYDDRPFHMPVVLNAAWPDREHVETRPHVLKDHGVFPYDDLEASQGEVPVREGAPVKITGISWAQDGTERDTWNHHTFEHPVHYNGTEFEHPRPESEHTAVVSRPTAVSGHEDIYGGDEGLRHHLCLHHGEHLDEGASREHMEDLHEDEHGYNPAHRGEWGCPEHSAEDEPTEFHDMHERNSGIGEIHRGIGVSLPDDLHRMVHDQSRPAHERARALLSHVSDHPEGDGHLGTHWTTENGVAEDFAETAAGWKRDEDDKSRPDHDHSFGHYTEDDEDEGPQHYRLPKPGTAVVFHAHEPHPDVVDRDPHRWGNGDVYGYSEHGEREVPVRSSHDLDLRGISWAQVHSDDEVPGHGEYTHHEFSHEHTAAVVAHFEAPPREYSAGRMLVSDIRRPGEGKLSERPYTQNELAADIRANGVQQPLAVEHLPVHGGPTSFNGLHRLDAAEQAGVADVPVVVKHLPGAPPPMTGRRPSSEDEFNAAYDLERAGRWAGEHTAAALPGQDENGEWFYGAQPAHTAELPPEMHRGVGMYLPQDLHDHLRDESVPAADRAHALLNHMDERSARNAKYGDGGLGIHWSGKESSALGFATRYDQQNHPWQDFVHDPRVTRVVLHAQTADPSQMLRSKRKLDEHEIFGINHGEGEIPLKKRSRVHLNGISWGVNEKDAPLTRHDFPQQIRRTAGAHSAPEPGEDLLFHFEAEGHEMTASREGDERPFGYYTLRHRTEDLGERKPRHFIDAHTPEGAVVGRMNWFGTTGWVHHIDVGGEEDDAVNGSSSIGDGRDHQGRGLATAMWDWSQEMRPKAKHSKDQTSQGKAWVHGLKDRERREPPEGPPPGQVTAVVAHFEAEGISAEASGTDDYGMSHRPLADGAPVHDLTHEGGWPEDVYTHPQYYGSESRPGRAEREGLEQLRAARGNSAHPVTIYRASPPGAPYKMHMGDWVSLSPSYAAQHAWQHEEDDPDGPWHVHKAVVPAGHVRDAATMPYTEQGYWGPDIDSAHHSGPAPDPSVGRREAASPEEYGMSHRPDPTGPPLHDLSEGDMMPRDFYDRMHEYNLYSHDDGLLGEAAYQAERKIRLFRGKPEKKVTIWRSAPAVNPESRNAKRGEINHGDWVGLSRHKALAESYEVNDPSSGSLPANHPSRYHIWSARVPAKHVRNPDGDMTEWGYFGPDVKDIPHVSEECSHRARVKPREAVLEVVAHFEEAASSPEVAVEHQERPSGGASYPHMHVLTATHPDGTTAELRYMLSKRNSRGVVDHAFLPGGYADSLGKPLVQEARRLHPGTFVKGLPGIDEDWGKHLPSVTSLHRNLTVNLEPADRDFVHDESVPKAERARFLMDHMARGGPSMHWASQRGRAAAEQSFGDHEFRSPEHTQVALNAAPPSPEHVETDPERISRNGGYAYQAPDWEVPLKEGAPVTVNSVRWRTGNTGWTHHQFKGGHQFTAGMTVTAAEYGPKPEWQRGPEGASDEEESAHYDRQSKIRHGWDAHVLHGISTGDLHPDRAKELGYYFDGHQTDERGNHKWKPLPQHLYHVTTNLPGVREHGLKSRRELEQERGGHGLGGGPDDTISLTDDHGVAKNILRAVHEFHHVVNGRYTPAQMWEDAKAGRGAPRPFHEDLAGYHQPGWKDGDPLPRRVDSAVRGKELKTGGLVHSPQEMAESEGPGWTPHHDSSELTGGDGVKRYNVWERDLNPDERRAHAADFYKNFAAYRSWAGGHEDPLFFSTDTKAFAAKDPSHFAIVHARPRPGAMGHQVSALGEWRTGTGDALETHRAERLEGGHLKEASLSKEAVVTALENPHTHGQDWYHGTQAHPEDLAHGFSDPLNDDENAWNARLGTHFTSDHELGRWFAKGEHNTRRDDDGYALDDEEEPNPSVVHARLHLSNPKVYGSEHDMDHEAYEHEFAAGNHPSRDFPDDPESREWDEEHERPGMYEVHREFGDSHIPAHATSPVGTRNAGHPVRQIWLTTHPDAQGIARRFRERLQAQGHDGIVYGNAWERGPGGMNAPSAIAFNPDSIEVTRHHGDEEPCPHGRGGNAVVAHFEELRTAAGPYMQQKLFHMQPDPTLHEPESGRHNPADPEGHMAWREENEPDYKRPEETWDHPEYGNRDEELGIYRHPGKGWHCHACTAHAGEPVFHEAPDEVERHDTTRTDWNEEYPRIPGTVHRGMRLEDDGSYGRGSLSAYREAPAAEHTAREILGKLGDFGTHWTGDEAQARHYADVGTGHHRTEGDTMNVVVHARKPAREDIETDPETLADQNVFGIGYHDDEEIPLRGGAPVHVAGVSWKFHDEPHAAWRRHDFGEGAEHTAALDAVAHFEEGPLPEYHGEPLYHGTRSILEPGEHLTVEEAERHPNNPDIQTDPYVHATTDPREAHRWGERAKGFQAEHRHRGTDRERRIGPGQNADHAYRPRVYEVHPTGHVEPDLEYADTEHDSWRSASPMRVKREVEPLTCYDCPDTGGNEEHWPDHPHYEYLRQQADEDEADDGERGYTAALTEGPDQVSASEERGDRWHEFRNRSSEDLHRGIHVELPTAVHDYVHDESVPREKRAEALQHHFADLGEGLGMHWTPHPQIAQRAIWNAADAGHGLSGGRLYQGEPEVKTTDVMFHVRKPGERNRLPAREHDEHDIGWNYSRDEDEFPLRSGSPLRLTGISWKRHEPQYPNEPFEHVDFSKPVRHVSSMTALPPVVAHFEDDDEDPDYYLDDDDREDETPERDEDEPAEEPVAHRSYRLPYMIQPPEGELREHLHHHHGLDSHTSDLYMSPDNQRRWHNSEHQYKTNSTHQHDHPQGAPGEEHWPDVFQLSEHTDFPGGTRGDWNRVPGHTAPFKPLRSSESVSLPEVTAVLPQPGEEMWGHLQEGHGLSGAKTPGTDFMNDLHSRFHSGQTADLRHVPHQHGDSGGPPASGQSARDSISRMFTPIPAEELEAQRQAREPKPERLDDREYSLRDVSRHYDWEGFSSHEIEHLVHRPENAAFTKEDVPVKSLRHIDEHGSLVHPPSYRDIAGQGDDERQRLEGLEQGYDQDAPVPPIVTVRDGEHHIIADGSHRAAVHAERGSTHIPAFVTQRTIYPEEHTAAVTAAYDWNTDEGPFTWDEIAQRHPRVYGDDEDHEPGMGEGGGHDIADAAAELYHDRPGHPYSQSEGELHPSNGSPKADIEFHPRTVDVNRIDYMRVDRDEHDPRVERAKKGFQDHRQREKIPPLILVHRHGVYQVADGSHRGNGAAQAGWPSVRAYVAYSPHEDEPFAGRDGEPPQRGPFHGAETENRPPMMDHNGEPARRISFPGFPHTTERPRPQAHEAALVAHFEEPRLVIMEPVNDVVLAPTGPLAAVVEAARALGSWEPESAEELLRAVHGFPEVLAALRNGVLRVARVTEELPVHPDVADMICDMARSLLAGSEDAAVLLRNLPPEASCEESSPPNR